VSGATVWAACRQRANRQTRNGNRLSVYRRDFVLDVGGKSFTGWVGVLERGSRARAGFSILVANRVIKG
jgi:hypothetical protein